MLTGYYWAGRQERHDSGLGSRGGVVTGNVGSHYGHLMARGGVVTGNRGSLDGDRRYNLSRLTRSSVVARSRRRRGNRHRFHHRFVTRGHVMARG